MKTTQSDPGRIPALARLAAEYRAGDQARCNAARLTNWRVLIAAALLFFWSAAKLNEEDEHEDNAV